MKGQIEKRAFSGAISGAVGFAVTLLQTVVAVPILLSLWGQEKYGMWLALTATTTLLATLDLGHQNYLGNAFNQDLPKGIEHLRARLASGVRIAFLLGGIQVIIALLLITMGKLGWLLGLSSAQLEEGQIHFAFISLVLNWAVFGSVMGILARLYPPYGLYSEAQWIGIFQRVAQFGLLIAVAMTGGFLLEYSFAMWGLSVVFSLVWLPLIYRRFPELFPWWKGGSWRMSWHNLSRSSVLTLNGFIAQFSLSGLSLLVASQFNAATVPLFTTARTVANTFSQASMVLTNPLLPDLVRFHVRQEKEKLMQAFQACWFSGGAIINLGIIAVVPFIPWLYRLWTHGRLEFNLPLFSLLAWSVAIRSAYSPLSSYVSGLNRLRAQFIVNAVQTGITVGLPLLLSRQMGLAAFGLGVVVGEIWAAGAYCWYASQEIEVGLTFFARAYLLQALLPVMVVGSVLASTWSESDTVIISATAVGLLLLTVFYAFTWTRLPESLQSRFVRLLPPAFQKLFPRLLK